MKFISEIHSVISKKKGQDILYTVTLHTDNPEVLKLGVERGTVIVTVEEDPNCI